MKVEFQYPELVSQGSSPDVLVTEVNQEAFFSRVDSPPAIKKGTQVKRLLPKMMLKD